MAYTNKTQNPDGTSSTVIGLEGRNSSLRCFFSGRFVDFVLPKVYCCLILCVCAHARVCWCVWCTIRVKLWLIFNETVVFRWMTFIQICSVNMLQQLYTCCLSRIEIHFSFVNLSTFSHRRQNNGAFLCAVEQKFNNVNNALVFARKFNKQLSRCCKVVVSVTSAC